MFFRVFPTSFKRCAIIVVRKVYLVSFASNIHDKIRMDTEYAWLVIEQMEEHNTWEKRRTICEMQIASATGRVYVIITDYLWDGILKLLHFSTVSTKWAPWNSVILQCKSRLASCALTWQAMRATASGWFNFNPRASRFWARNPVWWIRSPSSSRGLSLMTESSWIRS